MCYECGYLVTCVACVNKLVLFGSGVVLIFFLSLELPATLFLCIGTEIDDYKIILGAVNKFFEEQPCHPANEMSTEPARVDVFPPNTSNLKSLIRSPD